MERQAKITGKSWKFKTNLYLILENCDCRFQNDVAPKFMRNAGGMIPPTKTIQISLISATTSMIQWSHGLGQI